MTNENSEEPLDLHSLKHETAPSPELEERVVSELRDSGLIRSGSSLISYRRVFAIAAACLAFFVAGLLYQRHFVRASTPSVTMSDSTFVLFLMEGPEFVQPGDDRQLQERIGAYRNWAIDLRKRGIPVSGTKLRDEISILGNLKIENGKQELSGYFLIDAPSSEEAMAIARKCPHLLYGGSIEIRRVHPV